MAIFRSTTLIRLQAELGSGLFYDVPLVAKGESVIIPEPDASSGAVRDFSPYLVLRSDDDGQVYRWSLTDVDELTHYLRVSPDQSETPLPRLDLQLSVSWYRVEVKLLPDGDGNLLLSLATSAGQVWSNIRINLRAGFSSKNIRAGFSVPIFQARCAQ